MGQFIFNLTHKFNLFVIDILIKAKINFLFIFVSIIFNYLQFSYVNFRQFYRIFVLSLNDIVFLEFILIYFQLILEHLI